MVEADHTRRLSHEPQYGVARAPFGPVGVVGEVVVDGVDVDPFHVVVQLVALAELSLHPACSDRSRKPPCSSYEEVITESTSRAPRWVSPAARASASGLRSSASTPASPSGESTSAPALHAWQTTPPARAE